MPEDPSPLDRRPDGRPDDSIANRPGGMSAMPARLKPLKLPNTPINGFGSAADESEPQDDAPVSGGTAAGPPLAPSQDLLELELREQQDINRLRDLWRILIRALKAKRMYPANNPILQRILAECSIGMNETLEALGDLHLTIQQFDLLFLGQSIYHNASKKESIAFRFAKDGITELVFQEGLPPDELESFLSVMARAMETGSLEDDLVTLLWEQEFSHISYAYLAIDDLQEQQGLTQNDESLEVSWPESNDETLDEATGVPWTEHQGWIEEGGSGHRADDWNELIPVARVENRCSNDFLHLTSNEIEALAEEIHREHSRSLHDVVLEILTEVAEDETKPEAFADLARAFADLLVVVVQEADLRPAVEITATLKTLSASRGHDPGTFMPDTRDLTSQAVAALHRHPEADIALLPEFLVHLGPRTIDPICDLLVDVEQHALHGVLQQALVELAKQDLAPLSARMDSAPPQAARLLVQVLARVATPEADQALATATAHPEPRVRKEAIAALALSSQIVPRGYFLRALDDDDAQVRAAALHALRDSTSDATDRRALAERLLAVVSGPRFAEQSSVERKAYFEALVGLGGPIVTATFSAWLGLWRFGGGGDLKARRELAAWALSRMSDADAQSEFRRHARSFIPAVRGACKKAIEESQDQAA